MSSEYPDYTTIEPPDTEPTEYDTHERRAAVMQKVIEVGSPSGVNQTRLAERFGVDQSTISRDLDALGEYLDENLGSDARALSRVVYEHVRTELLAEDDWKAKRAAFNTMMDWNEWLADIGEQERVPDRQEVGVDVRGPASENEYEIVHESTGDEGEAIDPAELGFTVAPGVESSGETDVEEEPERV